MRTVGVAPGSYTLQLGAPMMYAPNSWQMNFPVAPCPPDEIGTGAYGVPTWNWYGYTLPPYIAPIPTAQQSAQGPLNPYGTQSTMRGFGAVLPPRVAPSSMIVTGPVAPTVDPSLLVNTTPMWKRWYVIVPAALGGLWLASKLLKRTPKT